MVFFGQKLWMKIYLTTICNENVSKVKSLTSPLLGYLRNQVPFLFCKTSLDMCKDERLLFYCKIFAQYKT